METQTITINRDDDPGEVVEAFVEALIPFDIVCVAEFGEDSATITLRSLR